MQKSLNQLYKESGTTLSYKEWRRREDEKMASFTSPTELLHKSSGYKDTLSKVQPEAIVKTELSGKTVFGINKNVLIIGGILIVVAIGYKIYQKNKS